ESEPQIILVSSAGPREGKTITTANLGITMAQAGGRVIILDCDMRRPMMHKIFGAAKDRGISKLLVDKIEAEGAIFHTHIPNLDLIPSGPIPPNPSEMLGSARMAAMLETLRKRYTRIIIDSPPATAVTDAIVLSKSVDGVILVIRAADTPREIVKNAIAQFKAVGANLLGAVLNGVDMSDKYHFYHYQYNYSYYGDDGEEKRKQRSKKRRGKSETRYGEE
ncbi:MAG: CpsD/CapB family tyrosine-protein kinase, partial [Pseudomonadota bacterium]